MLWWGLNQSLSIQKIRCMFLRKILLGSVIDKNKFLERSLINLCYIVAVNGLFVYNGWPVCCSRFCIWGCFRMLPASLQYRCLCVPWVLPVVMSLQQRWFMSFSVVSERESSHYKFGSFQHLCHSHRCAHIYTLALLWYSVPPPTQIDKNECVFVYEVLLWSNWHKWTKNIFHTHSLCLSSDEQVINIIIA